MNAESLGVINADRLKYIEYLVVLYKFCNGFFPITCPISFMDRTMA